MKKNRRKQRKIWKKTNPKEEQKKKTFPLFCCQKEKGKKKEKETMKQSMQLFCPKIFDPKKENIPPRLKKYILRKNEKRNSSEKKIFVFFTQLQHSKSKEN